MTFDPGTFAPAPRRVGPQAMAWAQGKIEAKLMLRHGEQQLLSLIIPLAILVVAARFPEVASLQEIFPMVLAVAATSSGFTGQAISLSFDRRYGALKRTGASGVPTWAIIAGKIIGVMAMVALQVVILGGVALLLGFHTSVLGALLGLITLLVGVAAFTALGLLIGGYLRSEVVLALANLIWFVLLGAVGWVLYSQGLGANGWWNVVPTVALAGGLTEAFAGWFPGTQLISLLGWLLVGAGGATACFRYDG